MKLYNYKNGGLLDIIRLNIENVNVIYFTFYYMMNLTTVYFQAWSKDKKFPFKMYLNYTLHLSIFKIINFHSLRHLYN